jgi:TonB family protein
MEGVEPRLLLELERPPRRYYVGVGSASALFHAFLLVSAAFLGRLPVGERTMVNVNAEVRRNVTPLVAPPATLTQRAPNRNPLSQEFNVAALPPRPANPSLQMPGAAALPKQNPRAARLPDQRRTALPNTTLADAPSLDAGQLRASTPTAPPPALGVPSQLPPPQIVPEEKPKLTFERPGVQNAQTGIGRVPAPKTSVEEAIRQAARGARSGGLVVGDEDVGGAGLPNSPAVPIPGKMGSAVELLSDPLGVDFSPYLIKVLSSVRRNWFAVIPESAKFGRVGRVAIQFAISRDGSVPKLVIATPSGTESFDRAAVAGISASNPFPPLPTEFKGNQIRLQFVFRYNTR